MVKSQVKTMTDLKKVPVLVINAAYEPALITTARRAFILLSKTDAQGHPIAVIEAFTDVSIHSGGNRPHLIPSVIRLTRYRHVPRRARVISRRGILTRDRHTCMYCGVQKGGFELTLDHIQPKSRGGPSSWENLVAACHPCNHRKANRTPEEANMKLIRRPLPFTVFSHRWVMRESAVDRPDWQPFLFYKNTTPQGEVVQ